MKKNLKSSKSLFFSLISITFIFVFSILVFMTLQKNKQNKLTNKKYSIKTICQKNNSNALDVNYLAEILNISKNEDFNIFKFDENKAKDKIFQNPLFKNIIIKKMKPNCLLLDYDLKKPIATLFDYKNIAIDEDGNIFPLNPFFKNDNLTKIYIGLDNLDSFKKIESKELKLALYILKKLEQVGFLDLVNLKLIDTSRCEMESFGKREIILSLEEKLKINIKNKNVTFIFPRILRVVESSFLKQISNYISLRDKMTKDYLNQIKDLNEISEKIVFETKTIDLRISKLAFIDN